MIQRGRRSRHSEEHLEVNNFRALSIAFLLAKTEKDVLIRSAMASPESPASRTRTVVLESSERRDAMASPAVPPPTITKSYELAIWPL